MAKKWAVSDPQTGEIRKTAGKAAAYREVLSSALALGSGAMRVYVDEGRGKWELYEKVDLSEISLPL